MNNRTIVSNNPKCFVEVLHRDSDPSVWIVRQWRKGFWLRKRVSSNWFINEQQALAFAQRIQRQHDAIERKYS